MDHSAEQTRGSPILPEHADLQRRRRAAMAVLAESEAAEIALLMVRGRMGGDGAPFNIGEATVTRAAVKLESGETGFGYVLGRDHAKARLVALCDALVQTTIYRNVVEREVVAPIRDRLDAAREHKAQQIAATKVE